MKYRKFLVVASILLSSLMAVAGGSVHRDDIQDLLMTNPVLANLIQRNLVLGEVGEALRLGKHMGDLGGSRIGPYEFSATVKPEGNPVILILNTEVTVTDARGRVFQLDQLTPQSTGLSLSEKLLSYETKATPLVGEKAQSIGDVVRFVSAASLKWAKKEIESDDDPASGELRRGSLGGMIRRATFDCNMGDHYGVEIDVFADANRKPVFVLITESSWSFVAPEKTEESVTQRRLYFKNGKLSKALEKSYRFRDDAQRQVKQDAAVNKKIAIEELAGAKWYRLSGALFFEQSSETLLRYAEAFSDFEQ